MSENAWRAVVAALSDDRAREIYARIVLRQPVAEALDNLPAKKARRIVDMLTRAGLVVREGQGYEAVTDVFARALTAAGSPPRAEGIDRFFTHGRLTSYPARAEDRQALLKRVAARVLDVGETITEADVTMRLAEVTDDTARLRRALVDEGLVERTPSGSEYRLAVV